jgi:heavy metal translocating P-type ATPase
MTMRRKEATLHIEGMDCSDCARNIEKNLAKLEGVISAEISFSTQTLSVIYDTDKTGIKEIEKKIRQLGCKVAKQEKKKPRLEPLLLLVVGTAILLSWFKVVPTFFSLNIAAIIATVVSGVPIFISAIRALWARSVTAEVAMATGMLASVAIGQYISAAVIGFFMLFAELIDEFTTEKSRGAISKLVRMTPKTAVVKRDGEEVTVGINDVRHGDVVLVKSGEMIPVDGVVVEGHGSVNQAPITGESIPVEKNVHDNVFAGSIFQLGTLQIKVTKVGRDTTLGRIIKLVEEAETKKAPIQKMADRFASRFIPIVFLAAALTFIFTRNITHSIAVIIVACPCAVALATPLAVIAGIGNAAERGIIIKGGIYLEELGKVDTVVVDKTGTMTIGEPRVVNVVSLDKHDRKEIIALAAMAEKHSEHPLASAIMRQAEEYEIKPDKNDHCEILPGKGIVADCDGQMIYLGSRELLNEKNIVIPNNAEPFIKMEEDQGRTALLVAHDNKLCGVISVADVVREEAKKAVEELKQRGMKIVMLTGDNPRTAKAVARQIGIDSIFGEMLPDEKVNKVKELVGQGRKVVMVGDGINDAPALAEASVGIAMGIAGTDAAIEAADVALMTDDLTKIDNAIKIGRRTFGVIKQNLLASIIFNVVGISLASIGILSPLMAAIAHTLPDFVLFLNSSRLLRR